MRWGQQQRVLLLLLLLSLFIFILIFLFFFSDFLIKNAIDLENSLFVCLFLKKSNWNEMFLIRIYFLIK